MLFATGGDAYDSEHLAMISGIVVQNNIFDAPSYSNDYNCVTGALVYVTFSYNIWHDNGQGWYGCGTGSYSSASVNFHFVSPGYPDYNYAIQAGSTACDFVPTSQPQPATDINGVTRPSHAESLTKTCPASRKWQGFGLV